MTNRINADQSSTNNEIIKTYPNLILTGENKTLPLPSPYLPSYSAATARQHSRTRILLQYRNLNSSTKRIIFLMSLRTPLV